MRTCKAWEADFIHPFTSHSLILCIVISCTVVLTACTEFEPDNTPNGLDYVSYDGKIEINSVQDSTWRAGFFRDARAYVIWEIPFAKPEFPADDREKYVWGPSGSAMDSSLIFEAKFLPLDGWTERGNLNFYSADSIELPPFAVGRFVLAVAGITFSRRSDISLVSLGFPEIYGWAPNVAIVYIEGDAAEYSKVPVLAWLTEFKQGYSLAQATYDADGSFERFVPATNGIVPIIHASRDLKPIPYPDWTK